MADKLHFSLVSPERELVNEDVDQVDVPGAEGEFGVLPHHAPVMAIIKPGSLRVYNGGQVRKIFVNGGFADVTPAGLTVLAEDAVDLANVDVAKLEEDVADAKDDAHLLPARKALARLEALKAALSR
jgi:F-type H+-transporting ATPase subunit epsilon